MRIDHVIVRAIFSIDVDLKLATEFKTFSSVSVYCAKDEKFSLFLGDRRSYTLKKRILLSYKSIVEMEEEKHCESNTQRRCPSK